MRKSHKSYHGFKFLCFLYITIFVFLLPLPVFARSLEKDYTHTFLFAVPEGGWSSCKVHIIYEEKYTYSISSERNTFNNRTKYYTGVYAYATTSPSLTTGAAVIKKANGDTLKTFSSWTRLESIYPQVDTFGYYKNTGTISLVPSTACTGQINFHVACPGAYPAFYNSNVKMSLSTE